MASKIDLGTHVLNSPWLDLKLIQHGTALVLPCTGTTGPGEMNDYETLQKGKGWLDQTPELQLHIRIRIGPHVHPVTSFFSRIGEVLCHSRIWLDLGLDVLFKSCDHMTELDYSTTVHLSFALRKKINPMNTSKYLRIPAGMRGLRDPVPPEGIHSAYLSTIDLYFEYTSYKRPTPKGMIGLETTESTFGNSQNLLLGSDIGSNKYDEILVDSTRLHAEYPHLEAAGTAERTTRLALKEGLRELERNSINPIQNISNICPMLPLAIPPLEKTLHTLFSSSVRNVIVGNLPETRMKALTPTSEGTKSLSQLCPSVFSLGYREAMSQRSQFIPSVATSISSILQNTKNPILQRGESIIASLTGSSQPNPPLARQEKATIRMALKQALWRSAQKQLYNPEASRNLSPLVFSSDLDENHPALKETALFAPPSTTGETDIIDADGEDTYGFDYYLGTEIDEFESLEAQDEAEDTTSLLSLTEGYANLPIDVFTTTSKDDTHSESIKTSDEMHIDSDMELNIGMGMHIDIEDPDHADDFYILPPASQQSVKLQSSDSEMLTSDCSKYDTGLMDPISQSTTETSIISGQEEIIIDEDFDDMLCELI